MAYMTKGGKGPYPCYASEYCGNHLPGARVLQPHGQSQEEAEYHQKMHLAKMRFGNPHSCEAFTAAEGKAHGYVGLYLKEDEPAHYRNPGDVLIDTPDELREPPPPAESEVTT